MATGYLKIPGPKKTRAPIPGINFWYGKSLWQWQIPGLLQEMMSQIAIEFCRENSQAAWVGNNQIWGLKNKITKMDPSPSLWDYGCDWAPSPNSDPSPNWFVSKPWNKTMLHHIWWNLHQITKTNLTYCITWGSNFKHIIVSHILTYV